MDGDQIECKFRHDPIRFSRTKNDTIEVIVDKTNTTGQSQKGQLRLRFNQVIDASSGLQKKNKTLIDVPVDSSIIKYPLPESKLPHTGYILKGTIKINTLELVKYMKKYYCNI